MSPRVRIRDETGLWAGVELQLSTALDTAAAACRVPWWVANVILDVLGSSSASASTTACQAVPLAVGENRLLVDSSGIDCVGGASVGNTPARGGPLHHASGRPAFVDSISGSRLPNLEVLAVREEPLQQLPLRPYEIAQLSVTLFVAGFLFLLWQRVSPVLAALLLGTIPVSRICPELPGLLWVGRFGVARPFSRGIAAAVACLAAVWVGYALATAARGTYGADARWASAVAAESRPLTPPLAESERSNCSDLAGRDCSMELRTWSGRGSCPVLAYTDGTCEAYCSKYNRSCERAADDVGTGVCALSLAPRGQSTEKNGCLQNWRVQICACGPLWRARCGTLACPPGYARHPESSNRSCVHDICTSEDVQTCCARVPPSQTEFPRREVLVVTMQLHNVDHQALVTNPDIFADFETHLSQAVSKKVGPPLEAKQVRLDTESSHYRLSLGPIEGISALELQRRLGSLQDFQHLVVASVDLACLGPARRARICRGLVSVSNVRPSVVAEPSAATPQRPASLKPKALPPCFFQDGSYEPLDMPGQARTFAASAAECQSRCERTSGCARFTWLWREGSCHLQEYRSKLEPREGAIAGPSDCGDEELLESLRRGSAPKSEPQRKPTTRVPSRAKQASEAKSAPPQTPTSPTSSTSHPPIFRLPPPIAEANSAVVAGVLIVLGVLAWSGILDAPTA
mmetsp:Transcript_2049/g.4632  ORF Transcript_2049/g.4632 Transcript_2049/m.4632 type:complete len:689 (+) Transcript_2049:32-2098(+)